MATGQIWFSVIFLEEWVVETNSNGMLAPSNWMNIFIVIVKKRLEIVLVKCKVLYILFCSDMELDNKTTKPGASVAFFRRDIDRRNPENSIKESWKLLHVHI